MLSGYDSLKARLVQRKCPHPQLEGSEGDKPQLDPRRLGRLDAVEHGVDHHGEVHHGHDDREPLHARVVGLGQPEEDGDPEVGVRQALL